VNPVSDARATNRNHRRAILVFAMTLAITTVTSVSSGAVAPAATVGQIGIGLLDAPAAVAKDSRAATYIVDQVKPGATIVRHVQVQNTSDRAQPVSVYAAGASVTGGQFQFADGVTPDELSQWTHAAPGQLTLAAHSAAELTATIAVPAGASGGERYAVLWAQVSTSTAANGISEVNRVGIRIYLDVSGRRGQPNDFAIGGVSPSRTRNGSPQVTAQVRNSGGQAVDISGTLTLTGGPGDLNVAPTRTDRVITLAPGQADTVTFTLGQQIPVGPWVATISLASGSLHHQARDRITFPKSSATVATVARPMPTKGKSSTILLAIGLGAIVVLGGLSVVSVWRRRHGRRDTSSMTAGNSAD
jgi:hypothetical protein